MICSTRFAFIVERSWKNMYFHPKMAWPPATYDVISYNHSNGPSLNLFQNVCEGWTNSCWKDTYVRGLNYFFQSVFTANNSTIEFSQETTAIFADHLSELILFSSEVAKVLNNIEPAKALSPDNIPGRLLKETSSEIAPCLCRLFNLSRCIFNHCYPHISSQLYHLHHGFLRGRSTVTQLLQVSHEVISAFAEDKEIDLIYLDFAKAFNKVPYSALIKKLSRFGISGQLRQWFQSYLSNRF